MAINKKLIHFKTWDKFIADGVQGNYSEPSEIKSDGTAVYGQLLGTSIVFIKDVQKIWTHGQLYNSVSWTEIDGNTAAVNNEKFIYAKTKDLFLEQLGTGNILDEAIVFIEDTKEIWNHGIYFATQLSKDEIEAIVVSSETVQSAMEQVVLDTLESLPVSIISDGDGSKFLADDGTYKYVETNPFEIPANGALPETGKTGKIYIIPSSVTGEDNIMQEYIWVDNKWEKLGEFKANVDLSGYYTKTETDTLVSTTKSSIDRSIETLNTDITSKLNNKLDGSTANETFATIESVSALDESKLNVSDAEQTYATITNLERKQDKLISGLSIKTINEESIVGSGNITIDTSVLDSTGVSEIRPMSQKATTDAIDTEVTRATTKESELETRIAEHESITEETYTLANEANIYAQTAFTNSQEAVNTANAAKEAVRVLEGLGGTDDAQTTLADRVQQISTNASDINVLKSKHVLITEEEFDALELKDPEKIYLIYEE